MVCCQGTLHNAASFAARNFHSRPIGFFWKAKQDLASDYFQRGLAAQQRTRHEIAAIFDKTIKGIRPDR
jgi:hypothetical protein